MRLEWQPNKEIKTPLYEQLSGYIRANIKSGDIPCGAKLPSQRKMCEIFSLSRTTVQTALNILESEKLIIQKKNSLPIVADNAWQNNDNNAADWIKYFKRSRLPMDNLSATLLRNTLVGGNQRINLSVSTLSAEFNAQETYASVMDIAKNKLLTSTVHARNKKGNSQLRDAVCNNLKKIGINANIEQVLILSSRRQAHNVITSALVGSNTICMTEKQSLANNYAFASLHNAEFSPINMDEHGILTAELDAEIKKHHIIQKKQPLLILDPTCHNPTGITTSLSRRVEILDITKHAKVPILESDVMRELWIDEPFPPPLKSMVGSDNVIYIGGFSKTLSSGIRLAWVVANELLINYLADTALRSDMHVSHVLQLMACELLQGEQYEKFLVKTRRLLKEKTVIADQILSKYLGDIASWESCSFYCWLDFHSDINIRKIYEQKRGIDFAPGFLFDRTDKSHISISPASLTVEQFDAGIKSLAKLIKG